MRTIIWLLGLLALIVAGKAAFIWSGTYNIAADEPHWTITERVMETVRDRSIAVRASGIVVPDLDDEASIRAGAGNYDAMCTGCHLKPGVEKTEQSDGLYPAPPELARNRIDDPAAAFWVIKHGIKMSGMPAWGKSMEDEYIWGMVAFLRQLPDMSQDRYVELVEASGGHAHSGADAASQEHDAGAGHMPAADAVTEDHSKAPPHEH
ncbi:MAG TPA: cytochrome c [Steroidobacteraceae bacterium]